MSFPQALHTPLPDLSPGDRLAFDLPMEELHAFCKRHGIVELAVFGSVLDPEKFNDESDVDFLVTLPRDIVWSFGEIFDAERELSEIMGRKADLVFRKNIQFSRNNIRRKSILSSARVVARG